MKSTALSRPSPTPLLERVQVDGLAELCLALHSLAELLSVLQDLATGLVDQASDMRAVVLKFEAALTPPNQVA